MPPLRSIKQGTRLAAQDRVAKLVRNIEKRETVKLRQKEKKESISIFLGQARAQFKEKYGSYVEWRAQDSERDRARQDKERLLIDIVNQDKPTLTEPDLKKHIAEYREIPAHNPYLADVADMVRKNIRIANLSEKITGLIVGWEVEELKNVAEEIKNDGVEGIDAEVMRQFKEMLEEAERNPNIVAEKQAEAKKAKKGGKK